MFMVRTELSAGNSGCGRDQMFLPLSVLMT